MIWSKRETKPTSKVSYILTVVAYLVLLGIAIVTAPLVQAYYDVGVFPDSEASKDILEGVGDNIGTILLSFVVGFVLFLMSIAILRFGLFTSTFLALVEFYGLYVSAELFAGWLLHKTIDSVSLTLIIMLPFIVIQLSMFVALELAAILGQGGRVGFGFVALSATLGAFASALRSIEYFGIEFVFATIDSVFLVGSCTMCGVCIARSKCGGSGWWHLVALVLPTGLACAFSMYVEVESDAGMYAVGSVVAVITLVLAIALFNPIQKLPEADTPPNDQRPTNEQLTGPLASNAVVVE